MDALKLLMQDHAYTRAMFTEYEALGPRAFAGKRQLVERIFRELERHAAIEEEIFYPALREAVSDSESQLDEAEVEHASVKALLSQLGQMDSRDELYDAKVRVLGEYVAHHVREEEGGMFLLARAAKLDLAVLGGQMEARKEEIDAMPAGQVAPKWRPYVNVDQNQSSH
ncbi:hemerythrin domain-containing protein [Pseudoduganella sp.]|uniref:hemerythrin domain-containing protein n=1 Tax=Pseudoduganella sp. TaxID=1880898 RepID=UPI0035AE4EFC